MFPNLKAEMARRDIKLADLAAVLGVTVPTLSTKLNGKYPLTWDEAIKIKRFIGVDIPIEVLFSEEAC